MAHLPMRSPIAPRQLGRAQQLFGVVRRLHFPAAAVPDVVFTRLNRHYEAAISLATLVLRSASIDVGAGGPKGSAFLVDMNLVFERFVRQLLRNALDVDRAAFPDTAPHAALDEGGLVALRPDLCLLRGTKIVWVGDAKYKRLTPGSYPNADLYQLLAYSVALGLPGGTLIYAAADDVKEAEHVVVQAGKRLRVVALALGASPAKIKGRIRSLSREILTQSREMATGIGAMRPPHAGTAAYQVPA